MFLDIMTLFFSNRILEKRIGLNGRHQTMCTHNRAYQSLTNFTIFLHALVLFLSNHLHAVSARALSSLDRLGRQCPV